MGMGQGRVRPVFTALPPPGIVVVGRRRHRLRAPSSAAPGGAMAANPRHTAPAHAHEKGSLGWPARLVLRARRYSRNSGGGRTTVAPGTGGRGYLRQLFYDGSRSLPPFFGWRQARGWIAGRALRGQRAGPNVRVADCDRAGLQQDQGVLPAAGRRKGPWLAKWGRGMAKEICWIWETH